MKWNFILFLFLWNVGSLFAQTTPIELPSELDLSDSVAVRKYLSSIANVDQEQKATILLTLGELLINNYQYEMADIVLTECLKISSDPETLAKANFQSGLSHMYRDIRIRSLKYLEQALKGFSSLQDSTWMGRTMDKIADNYNYIGEHQTARPYYDRCILIFTAIQDTAALTNVLGNIGGMMSEDNIPDSALYYYQKAMQLNRQAGQLSNLSHDLSGIAIALQGLNRWEESLNYLHQCLQIARLSGTDLDLGFAHQHLGYYHFRVKRYDSAQYYMTIANDYGKKMNYGQLLVNTYDVLHQAAYQQREYQRAYDIFSTSKNLGDSLLSLENVTLINSIRSDYEMQQQEAEKEALRKQAALREEFIKQQQQLNTALILGAILLITAIISLYSLNRNRKKKNEIIQRDRDLIQEQANKLKELDSFKSTFFANIAHDFRAPITLINGYIDLIKMNEPDLKEESLEYMQQVKETSKRLDQMTSEINQLILLEENRYQLSYSALDINEFFGTIGKMFKTGNQHSSLRFTYTSHVPQNTIMQADKNALEKVVFNLLGNAFKYNQTGTYVKLEIALVDHLLQINVCDDGPGIKEATIEKIFERYYRSEKGEQMALGLGIGLSLAKDIIDLHGGKIHVESEPNVLTCFEVTLPLDRTS